MKDTLTINIADQHAMFILGKQLAAACSIGSLIFLYGELGAGKTTLARGFLTYHDCKGPLKSPTFTIVESYNLADLDIYHLDLYRIHIPDEVRYIGLGDYIDANTICLIEWPEKGQPFLPDPDLSLYIDFAKPGRLVKIVAASAKGQQMLTAVADKGL